MPACGGCTAAEAFANTKPAARPALLRCCRVWHAHMQACHAHQHLAVVRLWESADCSGGTGSHGLEVAAPAMEYSEGESVFGPLDVDDHDGHAAGTGPDQTRREVSNGGGFATSIACVAPAPLLLADHLPALPVSTTSTTPCPRRRPVHVAHVLHGLCCGAWPAAASWAAAAPAAGRKLGLRAPAFTTHR
jgi:hypothetical protein